jgi:hypothetical protein
MWIERFEARYVDLYRTLLVLIMAATTLGFILAAGNWAQTKLLHKQYVAEKEFAAPKWEDVRLSVLPAIKDATDVEEKAASEKRVTPKKEEPLIDPRVVEIHQILSEQFKRNTNGVEEFRTLVPRRFLQEVLLENHIIPNDWQIEYLQHVKLLAVDLSMDERINRISSLESRAETLLLAIQRFALAFRDRVDAARAKANQLNEQERARDETATDLLLKVLPISVGVFLSIILLIVFIRIEVHLRKLADNA